MIGGRLGEGGDPGGCPKVVPEEDLLDSDLERMEVSGPCFVGDIHLCTLGHVINCLSLGFLTSKIRITVLLGEVRDAACEAPNIAWHMAG